MTDNLKDCEYRVQELHRGKGIEGCPWAYRFDKNWGCFRIDHVPTGLGGALPGRIIRTEEQAAEILNRLSAADVPEHDARNAQEVANAWEGVFKEVYDDPGLDLSPMKHIELIVCVDKHGCYAVAPNTADQMLRTFESLEKGARVSVVRATVPFPDIGSPEMVNAEIVEPEES